MARCDFCGKEASLPFRCHECDGHFCAEHRHTFSHACPKRRPVPTAPAPVDPAPSAPESLPPASPPGRRPRAGTAVAIVVLVAVLAAAAFAASACLAGSDAPAPASGPSATVTATVAAPPTATASPAISIAPVRATPAVTARPTTPVPAATTPNPKSYFTDGQFYSFAYHLRSSHGTFLCTLYEGVHAELKTRDVPYRNDPAEYYRGIVDEPLQREAIDDVVSQIKAQVEGPDNQLRVATSFVQQIPYPSTASEYSDWRVRFPYETLIEGVGDCDDKSLVLASILKELGYGVVLFRFTSEAHMAVGVTCPVEYSFRDTGYAFIETTTPSIITDDEMYYSNGLPLTSTPEIVVISDGNSFETVWEEYRDARTWQLLLSRGPTLSATDYRRWRTLADKYGITESLHA